ncbi:MAG: hypothetical protein NC311_03810 [Muribaculaceae bacterium]|nr:hypothetical protein [Muribaculaceae bacterium]
MNKKLITSMFAVAVITTTSAHAVITQEQCEKSDKTIWVENVQNADGTRGACVPKNACDSKAFKDKFCNRIFKDVQLPSSGDAELMIFRYLKHQNLVNDMGDIRFYHVSVDNAIGQDYMGASYKGGNYATFEFDDTNEHVYSAYEEGMAKAFCLANGGTFQGTQNSNYACAQMSESTCVDMLGWLNGGTTYTDGICLYKMKLN